MSQYTYLSECSLKFSHSFCIKRRFKLKLKHWNTVNSNSNCSNNQKYLRNLVVIFIFNRVINDTIIHTMTWEKKCCTLMMSYTYKWFLVFAIHSSPARCYFKMFAKHIEQQKKCRKQNRQYLQFVTCNHQNNQYIESS